MASYIRYNYMGAPLIDWNIEELTGYKPKTTFYTDFGIAERFGEDAIRDTYERAVDGWKDDIEWLTEIVMVLNWKIWEHYHGGNDKLAMLYDELWREQQARTMICNLTVTMETPKNEPVTVRAYMAVDEKMMVDDGIVDDEIVDENISESKDGGFKGVELRRRAVRRYESIKTVLESGEKTNSLMMMAMKELLSFERKYATLEELAGVFREIDKLKTTA